jgi:formate hydrogenlyase subunit 6/NADH:ubiquinone oxidoreductase subunit I
MYINPAECIDCEACVEACPVDAIFAADELPERWLQYTEINIGYFESNGRG